jgi:acetyl-CoA C-acetyltransferase
MQAVMNGDTSIRAGDAGLILAGGIESMSQSGFVLSHRARWGYKTLIGQPEQLKDAMLTDGLTDPMTGELMGEETERLAKLHGITRGELDEVAYLSNSRAAAATEQGYFSAEIAPIEIALRKGSVTIAKDEGIRPEATIESLGKLRPAFTPDGVLTAGNSSQLSDGAAGLLLASQEAVAAHGLKPIARILGAAAAGVEPWRFVEGPVPAIHKLMKKLSMQVEDFDLVENNEAFALNSVLLRRALGISYDRINVNGGAIALGHPIGASGARIIVTLVHALRRLGKRRGLASLCHGVGGGTVVAVEIME